MANSFTRKTNWLWQNAEKILIILFLATFTLNIRKVFLTPYSFLNGTFNEYLTMSFSWADALMIAVIFIYTIKLLYSQFRGATSNISLQYNDTQYKSSVLHRITNVSRLPRTIIAYLCQFTKATSKKAIMVRGETYFLLFFIGWCITSVIWSYYKPIAIYRCLTLLEVSLFFFIVYKNLVANDRLIRYSLISVGINSFVQAIIGIIQFIYDHSLGLRFLGESIVSRETPGVAKLVIDGVKHIRAYGTFPHPNIMAGFLIIPLIIILISLLDRWQPKIFFDSASFRKIDRSKFVSRATNLNQIPTSLILAFLFVTGLGFIFTFSRSAFLGLFLALLLTLYSFIRNLRHKIIVLASLLLIAAAMIGSIHMTSWSNSLFSDQSIKERVFYADVSREIISEHPLLGVGMGQFVLRGFSENSALEGWQYQPVHNLYLLITSELGIIGLTLFLLFIATLLFGQGRRVRYDFLLTINMYYCIIYSFLIVALFDHYFWDIKIAIIIFTLPIIFLKTASCTKA